MALVIALSFAFMISDMAIAVSPDIKANNSDGPVNITQNDDLSVTVELDSDGNYAIADWWVIADTPFDWYYYNLCVGSWVPGFYVTYQGALFDLTTFEVLNISGLPEGIYNFYFGVDMNMNSLVDEPLYYDRVKVNVNTLIASSVDIAAFQSRRNGTWFSVDLSTLPGTQLEPYVYFDIKESVVDNRKNGQISPTLLSGYFFIQWDISSSALEQYNHTIRALFLRSALMRFIDYPNNRALGWNDKSINIPTDIRGIISQCNEKNIPVFLEINYSDYIPGSLGMGVESLEKTDNIANTINFIKTLKDEGIHVDGVTFGDEIEDEAGYGTCKPTITNSDLIGIFISYALAIKAEFPELKIYAFDSYISATRGRVSMYWDFFEKIRQAERKEGKNLIDGFIFRESYVYIDEEGNLLESQLVLDDTESLYRDTPVYRYDVRGNSHPNQDTAYLYEIINKTDEIFDRYIDVGLTEYLPAVPVQMGEIDTSQYSDCDFILHFSDTVGIYAQLGLDFVSKIMFGDSVDMHKSYFDREGNLGTNYPVHEQLAQYFSGEILNVNRSVNYENLKAKVYAVRHDENYFIMILNKEVNQEINIRITLPQRLDLTFRLPRRSYTSLIFDGSNVTISGIGN